MNNRGMMLITTLGLAATVITLSAAILTASVVEIKAAEKFEHRTIAFHWAEGAIDQTLVQLRTNAAYVGIPATAAMANVSGTYLSAVTPMGNGVYRINSTASITGTPSVLAQSRSLQAYATIAASSSPFNSAVFAKDNIAMSGNVNTESYDSRNGAYSAARATHQGHIGSNNTGAATIALSGNVKIKGNVTVGPGADLNVAIRTPGNVTISGTQSAASAPTVLDPVVVPANAVNLGVLNVNSLTPRTLSGGTYVVSTLNVSGLGKLRVTGETTIYVTTGVIITGGGTVSDNNVVSLPTNLRLYVQGIQVNMSGNAKFYGAIYAPNAQVNMSGNSKIYGSVVGRWVNCSGNNDIYFDEALKTAGGSSNSSSDVTYWTEM